MNSRQAITAQKAMKLIALGLVEEDVLHFDETTSDFDILRDKVDTLMLTHAMRQTLQMTADALGRFSEKLADAHRAAAKITVSAPSDGEVTAFKGALEELNDDIQNDQQARASLNLLLSLRESIPDLA